MMSGVHKDAQSQARALLNCKATSFLKKPFTREELLSKIKGVLG
jgi:DNA-binding response OmpR family regulator